MNAKLIEAIRNKRIIIFTYKNHIRIVEPHSYGTGHQHQEILRGYQTGGKSENSIPHWLIVNISEISELKITNGSFNAPQKDYYKKDTSFNRIYCEL